MKTLILDGSHAGDLKASQINPVLQQELQARGWETENIVVREQKIGNCAGDFFCWVRNPGMCNINDDNRVIAAKMVQSDLLVYLTPVTFGGYSSALKRMVDHQVQNILPFFAKVEGEVHHQRRYTSYPKLLVIGWTESPDARAEAVFRQLVRRNAINVCAQTAVCGVLVGDQTQGQLANQMHGWLEDAVKGTRSPASDLLEAEMDTVEANATQRAVLLVGSPRTRKSTSASLGGYLTEQLAARGVKTETIQIYTSLNSRERMGRLLESVDAADLVVLAFPLYVDGLPGPVTLALERIASHRAGKRTTQRLAAIVNCGFPEAAQTATASAICAVFAQQAGFGWAGSLALGGGEGVVHGVPLHELDGRAIPLKKALEMTASALVDGKPVPRAAADLMGKPVIPNWVYLLSGAYGWRHEARRYGTGKVLERRPYEMAKGSE